MTEKTFSVELTKEEAKVIKAEIRIIMGSKFKYMDNVFVCLSEEEQETYTALVKKADSVLKTIEGKMNAILGEEEYDTVIFE